MNTIKNNKLVYDGSSGITVGPDQTCKREFLDHNAYLGMVDAKLDDNMRKDYEKAKSFWNTAFAMDDDAKKEAKTSVDQDNDWKQMAPSERLFEAARSMGKRKKVLDYGCGRGWAAIIAAKSGCTDVTAVEVSENAVETAAFHVKLFGVEENVTVSHVSDRWIAEASSETYDGIFCSNVLDVVPEAVAENILANLERIAQKGASVVIGMNYYMEPQDNPEKKMTVKNGNHIYLNDILRLVCRTDKEWTEIFSRFFTVEKMEHFAWPGEDKERRRLFYLRKDDTA